MTQEKNIKNYIHLYPKVPIAICEPGIEPVGHYLEGYDWNLEQAIAERVKYPIEWIKLILRPLSSITDDERMDWELIGLSCPNADKYKTAIMEAEATLFLLSKHFDVFGLIDAGLALDATTLKQTTL
jgi:hypothetical protein